VAEVELRIVDAGSDDARWAMARYFAELDERFTDGFDPGDALEEAVELLNPPAGVFVLAVRDGDPVGCGGVQRLDGGTVEVKRMWVHPDARGAGLGKRLLARLEGEARGLGGQQVVLDTNGVLTEAITMYRSAGYAPTDRYNDNPYAQHWFTKPLG
jgi:GNAT superfamily N-acetyltransferase